MSEQLRSNEEAIREFNSDPGMLNKYQGQWVIFVDGIFYADYSGSDKRIILANITVQENEGVALDENRYIVFKVPLQNEITSPTNLLSNLESLRS
jgi:hypothetical protein